MEVNRLLFTNAEFVNRSFIGVEKILYVLLTFNINGIYYIVFFKDGDVFWY